MIAPSLSQTSNITLPGVAMTSLLTWLKSQLYLRSRGFSQGKWGYRDIMVAIMGLVISPAPFFQYFDQFFALDGTIFERKVGWYHWMVSEIHDPQNLRLF